jgi:hypothetical protein
MFVVGIIPNQPARIRPVLRGMRRKALRSPAERDFTFLAPKYPKQDYGPVRYVQGRL